MLQTVSESCGPRILVESKCAGTVDINAGAGTEVDDIAYTSVVGTAVDRGRGVINADHGDSERRVT